MDKVKQSLKAFFNSDLHVLVIKGNWGVGKTYFWNEFIKDKIESFESDQIAYSYVSLFGKSNLADIKQTIFQSAKPIKSNKNINNSFDDVFANESRIFSILPWIRATIKSSKNKIPLLGWFTKYSKDVPYIKQFSSIISSLEYSMINNYVICIDDLERKSKTISIREIMGLVDELAQRKACKVILIFNEKSFDESVDKEDFEKYREKVVDIEVSYKPTFKEILDCVLSKNEPYYSKILELIEILSIQNIRIVKKIKWVLNETWETVQGKETRLIDEFLTHIVLFCWSYYKSDNSLPLDFMEEKLKSNPWLASLYRDDKNEDETTKKYKTLAANLSLKSAIYDQDIIALLRQGFINKNELNQKMKKLSEEIQIDLTGEKLRQAWEIYSESFEDNLQEFKAELKAILDDDINKIKLNDFTSTINVLLEYGMDVNSYIEDYVDAHKDKLKTINPRDSWQLSELMHPLFKEKVEFLYNDSKNLTIDEVALGLAVNNSWNPEDIDFLDSLSTEDYFNWMHSRPENLSKKVRNGLLGFRNIKASNNENQKKYARITGKVIDALKRIAKENIFNKKRVKNIYDVDIEET